MYQFNTINNRFLITSHGNGWAYEITDNNTGESIWVQDDAACDIQQATQNFECEDAIEQYFGLEY